MDIMFTLCGCLLSAHSVDTISTKVQKSGGEFTASQFIVISSLLFPVVFYRRKFKPKKLLLIAGLYWLSAVLTNYSVNYKIYSGVSSLIKSSNLILGELITAAFGVNKLSYGRIIACILIMIGVVNLTQTPQTDNTYIDPIGVTLLILSMFTGLILGHYQKKLSKDHSWIEITFALHFIPLPLFFLLIDSINIPLDYILINGLSQSICIIGVNILYGYYTPSQIGIMLTIRKALTVIISNYYTQTLPFNQLILSMGFILGGSLLHLNF